MLEKIKDFIDIINEEEETKPDIVNTIYACYIISLFDDYSVCPIGKEILFEWGIKSRLAALIGNKFIVSYSGKFNGLYTFDNIEDFVEQIKILKNAEFLN